MGRNLPEDATPPVIQKFDNDSTPVITISLSADRSIRELTELADKTVRVQLERVSGVGEVRVVGGLDRAINVWIDAERLAAYQIPVTAIRSALDVRMLMCRVATSTPVAKNWCCERSAVTPSRAVSKKAAVEGALTEFNNQFLAGRQAAARSRKCRRSSICVAASVR